MATTRLRKMLVWAAVGIVGLIAVYSAAQAVMMAGVKEPAFELVERVGSIEIRSYRPMIVAEVETEGARETAINAGFRLLAAYIFGANTQSGKIAMTVPVTQAPQSQKIAMTAPVTQTPSGAPNRWLVRFVMPAEFTLETLPRPNDPRVRLKELAAHRAVALRFSGLHSEAHLSERRRELDAFLKARGLVPRTEPQFAFYNPPWTLPFLRRTEVIAVLD